MIHLRCFRMDCGIFSDTEMTGAKLVHTKGDISRHAQDSPSKEIHINAK